MKLSTLVEQMDIFYKTKRGRIYDNWVIIFSIILALTSLQYFNVVLPGLYLLLIIGFIITQNPARTLNTYTLLYLIVISISLLINYTDSDIYNFFRLLSFIMLICIFGPLYKTKLLFEIRLKFIYLMLFISVMITIVSFSIDVLGLISVESYLPPFNSFRGITTQPMILAPISGLSVIILFYKIRNFKSIKNIIYFCLLIISFLVIIKTGSRSALLATTIALIFVNNKKLKTIIILSASILIFIFYPNLINFFNQTAVMRKIEYSVYYENNSRSLKWESRFEEIQDNPIIGIGFSNASDFMVEKDKNLEPGSSWLYIISSTGFLGFISFIMMIISTLKNIKFGFTSYANIISIPLLGIFIFFLIHGIFEGYVTFSGNLLTYIFWTTLGLIYSINSNMLKGLSFNTPSKISISSFKL